MIDIKNEQQYNQGISRYKLLSNNAGVGSIITSGVGTYILIADINKWDFIRAANLRIADIRNDPDTTRVGWYKTAKREIDNNLGVELVDDQRFVEFLQLDKHLPNLLCLAAIPHLSLNESSNRINLLDNPVVKRLKERGIERKEENFSIPGTHFPKWFRNDEGKLKLYKTWKEEWKRSAKPVYFFAPPRDPENAYRNGAKIKIDQAGNTIDVYKELTQLNLILICENGHLSDIPWDRYLRWRTETGPGKGDGSNIFIDGQPCCEQPALKWSESRNRSEGYGSVFLECTNCGLGSGEKGKPKINLEGINNLKPLCPGHKPWETALEEGSDELPFDPDCCDVTGKPTTMQIALATGNNVYFANTFSSVYVPTQLVIGISEDLRTALDGCELRYASVKDIHKTRETWADRKIDTYLLDEMSLNVYNPASFVEELKKAFIEELDRPLLEDKDDLHEQYRRQEYEVFTKDKDTGSSKGLIFHDIALSPGLSRYFTRIKKIEELKVTSVQLDLARVHPKERTLGPDGKPIADAGKNIFSVPPAEVYILPAVENYGEGIFFELNADRIQEWMDRFGAVLDQRIDGLLPIEKGFNGHALRQRIGRSGPKFLLVHTFSHLMMRELEFTCGYPTASLEERLYIAPDMAGVLIYTAEGSEGSMGGLIWQAEASRMEQLLENALERALDCSSDPLCWEIDGQGVFNLNLAACFSCALVAETACEERNLGLDRRVLIDSEFGFFTAF